jgi:hypothetical protein
MRKAGRQEGRKRGRQEDRKTGRQEDRPRHSGRARDEVRLLEAIARDAALYWPTLAPRGGTHWTTEDVNRAVSILYFVTQMAAFRERFPRGSESAEARPYLVVSLRHALLATQRRRARVEYHDPETLEGLASPDAPSKVLACEDQRMMAARLDRILTSAECEEVLLRIGGTGLGSPGKPRSAGCSRATRHRRWRSLSDKLVEFARRNRLSMKELGSVLEGAMSTVRDRQAGKKPNP